MLRPVVTYWGMVASFVLDGSLSENAFLKPRFSREMFIVFAQLRPILKDLRQQTDNPDFMANMEKVILNSAKSQAA